ncbi:hypothetical protein ELG75_13510 [Rhizobium leguminosarum]|nr:hypothetical protein ELG81_13495 [Rhizobium leguminosarum]TBG47418.1 hypothetical protein ELG75_13510 [Rhizobium leguminosarum]TBG80388.1 hypothetical protein ELG76_13845 [Rhizobium leguminosarum]
MWSPFVLSKQTESQLADFTQLFFGQALRKGGGCGRSSCASQKHQRPPSTREISGGCMMLTGAVSKGG